MADNALRIDDNFLQDIGLSDLPMEEKDLLINQIYEQLELRVGNRLANQMSDQQKEEFDTNYIQEEDQEGAMKWLQQNFPNYPSIVQEELQSLKEELKQQAGTIRDIIKQQQQEQQTQQQTPPQSQE